MSLILYPKTASAPAPAPATPQLSTSRPSSHGFRPQATLCHYGHYSPIHQTSSCTIHAPQLPLVATKAKHFLPPTTSQSTASTFQQINGYKFIPGNLQAQLYSASRSFDRRGYRRPEKSTTLWRWNLRWNSNSNQPHIQPGNKGRWGDASVREEVPQ